MTDRGHSTLSLHVVTHTHWDREWYRTAGEFRLGLVDLVDEVLDGAAGEHFLLDGQAIVLRDYLSVRPEREGALAAALRDGAVEAGPWYVLADNLIPGGEALVRNLLVGRAELARLGAAPPGVLYCPDAFGHPAVLPALAAGFGIPLCIVWRGYGGPPWPPGDSARWRATDGGEVLLYHLPPDGYELGSNLPAEPGAARATWERLRGILMPRATLGVALLPNGADHHAVQPRREEAIAALATAAAPVEVVSTGLQPFSDTLVQRAAARALPVVQGELRVSPDHVWSLQGTFGTRAAQKRANAHAERLLVHHVEPLAALAWWRDGRSRRHDGGALWRTLLACHPHDTLCGCSIDAVADAMDHRLDTVMRAGELAARRSALGRLGHDAAVARALVSQWVPVVALWNPVPRQRSGICELEVDEPLGVVAVGPGSAGQALPSRATRPLRLAHGVQAVQELSRELVHVREESPRHYPRNTLVLRRRILAVVDPVEGMEMRTIPLQRGRPRAGAVEHPVVATGDALDNGRCRVWIDGGASLCLTCADGTTLRDVVGLEVEGDRGDLYTHSAIPGTQSHGRIARHRLTRRGPLRGELRLTMRAVVPPRTLSRATGVEIRHRATPVTVTVDVRLDAGASAVILAVQGENLAEDCRVRLVVRTGVAHPEVWADAAFGEVSRPPIAATGAVGRGAAGEIPLPTAPLHRYVSLYAPERGVTVISDGLAEYEATAEGAVAVTLVRAVGELSRHDLPERPGHAGWPVATPGAQSRGHFGGRFAIFPHAPRSESVRCAVHQTVEDLLLPIVGETWASAVAPPERVAGLSLRGEGLALSCCKEGEDGHSLVVRCVNLLDRAVEGAWQLAGVQEAWLGRLDETPLGALAVRDGSVDFHAPPRATITVLLRR